MAPYEKRVLDILKAGGPTAEKRAYKFAKNRVRFVQPRSRISTNRILQLGTHTRAQRKREEIKAIWAKMRARA